MSSVSRKILVTSSVSRDKFVIFYVSRNLFVISFVSRNIFVILFSDLPLVLAIAALEPKWDSCDDILRKLTMFELQLRERETEEILTAEVRETLRITSAL